MLVAVYRPGYFGGVRNSYPGERLEPPWKWRSGVWSLGRPGRAGATHVPMSWSIHHRTERFVLYCNPIYSCRQSTPFGVYRRISVGDTGARPTPEFVIVYFDTVLVLHLISGVRALFFIGRGAQRSLSLVDHGVEICAPTKRSLSTIWSGT